MSLNVLATTPVQLLFLGLPVNGVMGRGRVTGDGTPVIGIMSWLNPERFSSLVYYGVGPARAQRILAAAQNRGGLELTDADDAASWVSLVITPVALEAAFLALGLIDAPVPVRSGAVADDPGPDLPGGVGLPT